MVMVEDGRMNHDADKQQDVSRVLRRDNPWHRFMKRLEHEMEVTFGKIGRLVSRSPYWTIGISLLMIFGFAAGLVTIQVESKGDKLWISQTSPPAMARDTVESLYGDFPRRELVLLVPNEQGLDILSRESIDSLFAMNTITETVTITKTVGGVETTFGYTDLCDTNHVGCMRSGVLDFWGWDKDAFDADGNYRETLSATEFPDGRSVNRGTLFSEPQTDENDIVTATQGFAVTWIMSTSPRVGGKTEGMTSDDMVDLMMDWEDKWLDELEAYSNSLLDGSSAPDALRVFYQAERSIDDELARSVGADIPLMVITYMIMGAFTTYGISRFQKGSKFIRFRALLATGGVFMIFLGIGAGYGFSSLVGVPFTSLAQVLPFILVGIGVDNMFILVAALDRTNRNNSIEDRIAEAMSVSGVTITTTSLTDMFAFWLGATTNIPAIRYFCLFAAFSLLINYFLQLFFFTALLTLDTRRVEKNGNPCLPCCLTVEPETDADATTTDAASDVSSETRTSTDASPTSSNPGWVEKYYAPFLLRLPVKIAVVLIFLAILATNIWAVTNVTVGFQLTLVTPDESYQRDFLNVLDNNFDFATTTSVGIYTLDADYHTFETQQMLQRLEEDAMSTEFSKGPLSSWHRAFTSEYIPSVDAYRTAATSVTFTTVSSGAEEQVEAFYITDETLFYEALTNFLANPRFITYASDFVWSAENGARIAAARFSIYHQQLGTDTNRQKDAMLAIRAAVDESEFNQAGDGEDRAFSFTYFYLFWDQYTIIYDELISNFIVVGAAVLAVCTFLLVYPVAAILTLAMVVMVDVHLLGQVYLSDLEINAVSVINLVMAVGLVVDYSVHIAHSYVSQKDHDRNRAVSKALVEMGPSVVKGGFTTFLGILPLAFASSHIFRTFFTMFMGIICYGLAHGLILLPVLLSWFGPVRDQQGGKDVDSGAGVASDGSVAVKSLGLTQVSSDEETGNESAVSDSDHNNTSFRARPIRAL